MFFTKLPQTCKNILFFYNKTSASVNTLNIPAFCHAILSNVPPNVMTWSMPRDVTPQTTGFLKNIQIRNVTKKVYPFMPNV